MEDAVSDVSVVRSSVVVEEKVVEEVEVGVAVSEVVPPYTQPGPRGIDGP